MFRFAFLFGLLLITSLAQNVRGAGEVAVAPPAWNVAKQGAFVMSLATDRLGNLWVGTEDFGV